MSSPEVRCASCEEDYSALLDGELPPGREVELRAHLEGCARCRERLDLLARADAALTGLASPPLPADLHARLRGRIARNGVVASASRRAASAPRRGRWWARSAAAAAVAAAAALALYLVLSSEPPAPLPAPTPPGPQIAQSTRPGPAGEPAGGPRAPVRVAPGGPAAGQPSPDAGALEAAPADDLDLALELDTIEDFDVIANLDLLERMVASEKGAS